MNKLEEYRVRVYCRNCDWHGTQNIAKGSSVEVLSGVECPICGCQELKSLGLSKNGALTEDIY